MQLSPVGPLLGGGTLRGIRRGFLGVALPLAFKSWFRFSAPQVCVLHPSGSAVYLFRSLGGGLDSLG